MMNELRSPRAENTRELILTAAERLFAERGLLAVSNRQVSEAAGQGNNAAVGYHVGTKADLIRAVARRHLDPMEQRRRRLLLRHDGSQEPRILVTVLVHPFTDHLAGLGRPTWYARFAAQVMTDPLHRAVIIEEALEAPTMQAVAEGLARCLPELPPDALAARQHMMRNLIVHTCAEQERALAEGNGDPVAAWAGTAAALTDAITGLLTAPVTSGD
ncbi:TetR/AcrR family transcriptional regulator [Actinoplanes sp. NPDC051494]|uniref:TetR/AcrR family transcriptional regulator n=1 Tax=Actinoplanes sp. NPDC051494 TaxID=3363907 RepID=UPI0037AE7A4A